MAKSLDERAVLRTAQLGLVLAFGSNLVSAAALVVAARSLKINEEYQFVATEPGEPWIGNPRAAAPIQKNEEPASAEHAAAQPPGIEGALTEEQRAVFFGSPEDAEPVELGGMRDEVYGRHYLASDEWNPHMFYEAIKGSGGGYMGVGTDQAYLFGSWARSELIWAIDYDPMVIDLHKVYEDFFAETETPEEFVALWTKEGKGDALKLLYRRHPDADERKPLRVAYLRGRIRVNRRLALLRRKLNEANISSYLDDQDLYDYVREMFKQGRVRAMLTDLTGEDGMRGIADASRQLGVPIRVIYLSNAEQYWKYSDQYRANIGRFEFDDTTLVLRTISSRKANGDYRYNVHVAKDYQEQLQDPNIRQVYQFVDLRRIKGRKDVDFSIIGDPPGEDEEPVDQEDVVPAAVGSGQE
jgi:hypothetical protein